MIIIKKYLRDISSSLLVIVGYVLLFFVAFNSIYLMEKIDETQPNTIIGDYNDRNFFLATSKPTGEGEDVLQGTISGVDKIKAVIDALKTTDGNTYINIQCMVDKLSITTSVSVVLSYNEACNRTLKSGVYPDFTSINNDRAIVIGEYFEDCTVDIDGNKYISINGALYLVTGIFKDMTYSQTDKSLAIFYPQVTDSVVEELIPQIYSNYVEVTVCGNSCDNVISDVKNTLESTGYFDIRKADTFSYDGINTIISAIKDVVMIMIVIFCIVNSIAISGMWLKRRQREIIIRKSYGYGNLEILKLIICDMVKYMLTAFALVIIAELLYMWLLNKIISFSYILNYCLGSVVLMMFIIFLTALINLKYITHIPVAQGVQKR